MLITLSLEKWSEDMDYSITPVLLLLGESMKDLGEGSVREWEETPVVPQGLERAGSIDLTP